jgi:hypothetical protein
MRNVQKVVWLLVAFTLIWGLAERQALSTEITVIRGVITASVGPRDIWADQR